MAYDQYSYVLTETAESDLDEILDYIANELMNPDAASFFADAFDEVMEEICRAPKTGRLVSNPYLKRSDVRRVLVKNYIAFYLLDDDREQIVVLRVVYSKRDLNEILKDL